jgi:uncharacterized integral membrane protein
MRFVGLIFFILIIGFMIGFWVLNNDLQVTVDLFGYKVSNLPLAMVCIYSFIAGMVFVLVLALADEIALRTLLYRLRRENKNLRKELTALRNLPFEDEQ